MLDTSTTVNRSQKDALELLSLMQLSQLDDAAFAALIEPHRRELQAHCYRLTGSAHDAEDMVQETFLRAWRRRETFAGRATLRAWLYKIATHVCFDALDKRPRRFIPQTRSAAPAGTTDPIPPMVTEPIWLEPYPDDLLAANEDSPEARYAARENISLAFVVALQRLPPRQRAILILRDVLDWQADEVAALLDITVSAVKSALHRARSTLAGMDVRAHEAGDLASAQIEAYITAWERADIDGLVRLLKEDAVFSMPPLPVWYQGRESIHGLVAKTVFSGSAAGRWRMHPTRANRQTAFGLYRLADAEGAYQPYGIQVLTVRDGQLSDIITFIDAALFRHFDLPAAL